MRGLASTRFSWRDQVVAESSTRGRGAGGLAGYFGGAAGGQVHLPTYFRLLPETDPGPPLFFPNGHGQQLSLVGLRQEA